MTTKEYGNKLQGKVILDLTMSLDGFIAGPKVSITNPMGEGGERLHNWIFAGKTDIDTEVLNETVETSGAVIVGGRTYHIAIDDAWGGASPFKVPAFVLSKNIPKTMVEGFTFVTDGIESAIAKAKAVAAGKHIWVMGGANIAQQYIKAGLLDEMQIHIANVLLGKGTRLFDQIGADQIELERTRVVTSAGVTHLRFRVKK